jgi:hypothetical protein
MHSVLKVTAALAAIAVAGYGQVTPDTRFQISYVANLDKDDSVVNITNTGLQGPFGLTGPGPGGVPAQATAGNLCANIYVFDPQEEEIYCCSCLVTPNGLNSLSVQSDLISNTLTPALPTSVVIKIVGTRPEGNLFGPRTTCDPSNLATATGAPLDLVENGLLAWNTNTHVSANGGLFHTEIAFRPALLGAPILPITRNGDITNGVATVNVADVTGIVVGMVVAGAGIAANTTVAATNPALSTFTLSAGAIATAGGVPLTFTPPALATNSVTELSQLANFCRFIQADGSGFGICKSCRTSGLSGSKK